VLVDVRGEIDIDSAPELDAVIRSHCDEGTSSVVLDLTEVTFMGSTGVNLLVALKIDCERRGIDLRLVASSRAVLHPLELTGLEGEFVIVADVEAVEAG